MERGADDADLVFIFLREDEEWERCAKLAMIIHNTTRTKKEDCKPQDSFNDSLAGNQTGQADAATESAFAFAAQREEEKRAEKRKANINGKQVIN